MCLIFVSQEESILLIGIQFLNNTYLILNLPYCNFELVYFLDFTFL